MSKRRKRPRQRAASEVHSRNAKDLEAPLPLWKQKADAFERNQFSSGAAVNGVRPLAERIPAQSLMPDRPTLKQSSSFYK